MHRKLDLTVIKNQNELLYQALQENGNSSKLILNWRCGSYFRGISANLHQDTLRQA